MDGVGEGGEKKTAGDESMVLNDEDLVDADDLEGEDLEDFEDADDVAMEI